MGLMREIYICKHPHYCVANDFRLGYFVHCCLLKFPEKKRKAIEILTCGTHC